MRQLRNTAAVRGILLSLLAVGMAGAWVMLSPVGPGLSAQPAGTVTMTPGFTEFGYAPAIFAPMSAASPGPPAGTATPSSPPTATPPGAMTSTVTATATPLATATPMAATATATPAPNVEPTPATSPLRVLETHVLTTDSGGWLTVRGEVINDGPRPVQGVRVPIEFRNKKGRLVHTETALLMLHQLSAGDKVCFAASLEPPIGWRTYAFGAITYQIDPDPAEGLEVAGAVGELDAFMGWYALTGTVTNGSTAPYSLLRLAATLYDAAGMVVGCDFAYSDNVDLGTGQADRFEFLFADREYPDAVGWHISAEGERR